MKLRFFTLFSLLLLLLSGCSSDKSAGQVIRYDIPNGISSLDPQFATDPTARMIISNLFEGLFRQLPSGEVVPAVAKSYDVSSDGLVYTFHLREDARWSDAKAATSTQPERPASVVSAHDFDFALRRMFDSVAFSPFAQELSAIQNAELILQGVLPLSSLGVRALDNTTLEIILDRPDHLLPERLSSSYAMPCNRTFFEGTRARYGLDPKSLIVNGPFYIRTWNNERVISLRLNKHYVSPEPTIAAGIDFYIPAKMQQANSADTSSAGFTLFAEKPKSYDPVDRFLAGTTDACKVGFSAIPTVKQMGGRYIAYEDTVWVLMLNPRLEYFANDNIRKAIAHTVDRSLFEPHLGENLHTTSVLIPPVVGSLGKSFREDAQNNSPISFDAARAKSLYMQGLEELELSGLPFDEILVYKNEDHPLLAGFVQQNLQKNLSLPTGLVTLSKEDLAARVSAGDYQAAIIPLTAAYSSPNAILSYFHSQASQGLSDPSDQALDRLLADASAQDGTQQSAAYQRIEQQLLAEGSVIPLFFETSYYAMGKGVSDIAFSPYLSGVYFKNARRAD